MEKLNRLSGVLNPVTETKVNGNPLTRNHDNQVMGATENNGVESFVQRVLDNRVRGAFSRNTEYPTE